MSRIVIRGGRVVTPIEERFTDVVVEDGLIKSVGQAPADAGGETIDATGCFVTPGLIDLQVNGAPSCSFWGNPSLSDVATFAEELVRAGVTTILPTLITDDLEHLGKNVEFLEKEVGVGVRQLENSQSDVQVESKGGKGGSTAKVKQRAIPVRMPGIHLEGPCLSPERPGVHPKEHIQPLTKAVVKRLVSDSVKLITLAPELDPSGQCVAELRSHGIEVELGHSNATYEEAKAAFDNGIKLMTHTYNALPPIHHRAPGAVTAALLDRRVMCCLICDGHHVSPPAAELVLRTKGIKGTILVTDVAPTGTSQGGLVGSSIMLDEAVRNVVKWGIATFSEAIVMATLNPARAMGWENRIGQLAAGKAGDVALWDQKTLKIKKVISRGYALS